MLQNSFQDLFKNLLILVLSYGLAMYMVVYLLDFPSWILSSPKIIKNYYYNNFTKNVILDYIYILGYLGIAFFIMDQFNITSNAEPSWRDNFLEGVPSPAGGILVLMPLIYSFSEIQLIAFDYDILVPSFFLLISILLMCKIPTYSLKKIVVKRSTTIFLLFSVILFFGLLLIFTFNTILISSLIYLLIIPISSMHYLSFQIKFSTQFDDSDDHEDIL